MARRSSFSAVALAAGLAACSWTRFDDVSADAPVLVLTKPSDVGSGFGSSLAFGDASGDYRLYAGAAPGRTGGAEYKLGPKQDISKDAVRSGHCGLGCSLAKSAASLRRATLEGNEHTLCTAEGLGTGTGKKPLGVQIQCTGEPAFVSVNEVPAGSAVVAGSSRYLSLASAAEDFPPLVAGVSAHKVDDGAQLVDVPQAAWFYASKSQTPVVLDPGSAGPSYGSSVAVWRAGGSQRLVVGEPDAGRVLVFDLTGSLEGCFAPGTPGFGRALAAGRVDKDADQELVVSSDGQVHVLSGKALSGALSGSCVAPPNGAELVALSCSETADLKGCSASRFGASLAVADIDRDDDGEVLVGAPDMDVREASDGGAVLVYDVEPEHPHWLLEARFLSSAESGDRLGASLAVIAQPDRDIFATGAPGGGKVAVFFCSKLLPSGKRGSRCE